MKRLFLEEWRNFPWQQSHGDGLPPPLLPSLQATGNQLNQTGVKLANFFSKP